MPSDSQLPCQSCRYRTRRNGWRFDSNAEALETLEKVDTLVVDKTGTLTEGKPRLVTVFSVDGSSEDELLRITASLEQGSEHPLAAAIVNGAREKNLLLASPGVFQSLTGRGTTGTVEGRAVVIGNVKLFQEQSISIEPLLPIAADLRNKGRTVMFIAIAGHATGLIGVADPIKSSTPEPIQMLHAEKLQIVMLTGITVRQHTG